MAGKGRPCELTSDIVARIAETVERGGAIGVNERTLYRWMARGRKEKEGQFRQLWQAIKKAEGAAVLRFVSVIQEAAPKHWQAAAWWLKRRYPLDWGRRECTELAQLEQRGREVKQSVPRSPRSTRENIHRGGAVPSK